MSVQTAWLEPFNMKYVNKYCSAQGYKSEISERCARRVSDEKRQEARLYIVYVNQGPFPLGWQAIQFFGRRRSNSRGHFALKHKLNNNNNRKHYKYCCRWATWHSYINCVGIFLSVDRNSTLHKLHDSRKQFCRRFFNVLNVYVFKTKWFFILYHAIENYKQEYLDKKQWLSVYLARTDQGFPLSSSAREINIQNLKLTKSVRSVTITSEKFYLNVILSQCWNKIALKSVFLKISQKNQPESVIPPSLDPYVCGIVSQNR